MLKLRVYAVKIRFCSKYLDGTKWLLNKGQLFIDPNHINEKGNEIIVKEIISRKLD